MVKKLRRAFTIVELVIVIAVIAILAAVLIPTFTSLIQKANQSNDTTNVKNMNTILTAAEATDGKAETMYDAVQVIKEGGYDLSKLTPTGEGYDIVWDQEYNRLALVNDGEVVFSDSQVSTEKWKLWIVTDEQIETEYSVYLNDGFAGDSYTAASGVDVGENEGINVTVATEGAKNDLKVRTNGGTLTVNAPNATVSHYGKVEIENLVVADHSFYEYGTVKNKAVITKGKFVSAQGSEIADIFAENNATVLAESGVISGNIYISDSILNISAQIELEGFIYAKGNSSLDVQIPAIVYISGESVEIIESLTEPIKENKVSTNEEFLNAIQNENAFISLANDLTFTEAIELSKSVVIYGNDYTIYNSANRIIRLASAGVELVAVDCNFISTCTAGSDVRGISFDPQLGENAGCRLVLDNCLLSASYYAINMTTGTDNNEIIIKNASVAAGWAAINSYTNNSKFSIINSTLKGINDKEESSWNNFATIVFDGWGLNQKENIGRYGSHNTVEIINSTIYSSTESSNSQQWLSFQYGAQYNTVTVDSSSKLIDDAGNDMSTNFLLSHHVGSSEDPVFYDSHCSVTIGNKTYIA